MINPTNSKFLGGDLAVATIVVNGDGKTERRKVQILRRVGFHDFSVAVIPTGSANDRIGGAQVVVSADVVEEWSTCKHEITSDCPHFS